MIDVAESEADQVGFSGEGKFTDLTRNESEVV